MLGTACVCSYLRVWVSLFGRLAPEVQEQALFELRACSQGANGTPDKKANYNGTSKQTLRAVTVQQLMKVGTV